MQEDPQAEEGAPDTWSNLGPPRDRTSLGT
jgi:hypothetical protein